MGLRIPFQTTVGVCLHSVFVHFLEIVNVSVCACTVMFFSNDGMLMTKMS